MLLNHLHFFLNLVFFVKVSSVFINPYPEPLVIDILHGWSGTYGHFKF